MLVFGFDGRPVPFDKIYREDNCVFVRVKRTRNAKVPLLAIICFAISALVRRNNWN
jgi:hypothetical protein